MGYDKYNAWLQVAIVDRHCNWFKPLRQVSFLESAEHLFE